MTARLAKGDRFEMDESRRYTLDGDKHVHDRTMLCEVTATDEVGFSYVVVEVTEERNRPHFAGTPTGGSVAWFALPLRIEKGTLRVIRNH